MLSDLKNFTRVFRYNAYCRQHFAWQGQPPRLGIENLTALLLLAGLAGLSLFIYLWVFVLPYNLLDWYQHPRLTLRRFAETNPFAQGWLIWAFLMQGGFYWLAWRLALQVHDRRAWGIVLGGALAFGLALLFLYPFDAADIFDNIMHGRIRGIYGANPFYNVAKQFANDPFYPYAAWRNFPSAYGPIWEALAGGIAWAATPGVGQPVLHFAVTTLGVDGIVLNVLAFKLLGGLFLAISVALVAVILRQVAPERALAGVVLLAWNPVVLYETMGHGHNDIVMAVWVLAATWALLSRRYTLAILALLVGALIKFIPLLFLPMAVLIALRDLPHSRARLRFLAATTASAGSLMVIAYGPFWHGLESLGLERRTHLFTASLAAAIRAGLQLSWGLKGIDWEIAIPAVILTVLFVLWQCRQSWRDYAGLNFAQAAFNILTFYLLVTCMWFQQWYVIWPLAVAALLPPGHAPRLAVLCSYMALSKPLIFDPWLFWSQPRLSRAQIEVVFGPAVLLVPWLYALLALWLVRKTKSKEGNLMHQPQFTMSHAGNSRQAQFNNALLVVAKRPAPGQTKTRLSPPLSPEQASALYECFLRDTLDLIRQTPGVQPVIAYLPQPEEGYFKGLAPDFELILQEGNDLGARLDHALTHYLQLGYERVVIMDSDSPTLPAACLKTAFEALEEANVVLGPCDDGGYYLIGLKRPAPRLLREVQMSTPTVVADTLALAAEEGLQVKLLPVWYDIDDATALDRLISETAKAPESVARHTRAFLASPATPIVGQPALRLFEVPAEEQFATTGKDSSSSLSTLKQ